MRRAAQRGDGWMPVPGVARGLRSGRWRRFGPRPAIVTSPTVRVGPLPVLLDPGRRRRGPRRRGVVPRPRPTATSPAPCSTASPRRARPRRWRPRSRPTSTPAPATSSWPRPTHGDTLEVVRLAAEEVLPLPGPPVTPHHRSGGGSCRVRGEFDRQDARCRVTGPLDGIRVVEVAIGVSRPAAGPCRRGARAVAGRPRRHRHPGRRDRAAGHRRRASPGAGCGTGARTIVAIDDPTDLLRGADVAIVYGDGDVDVDAPIVARCHGDSWFLDRGPRRLLHPAGRPPTGPDARRRPGQRHRRRLPADGVGAGPAAPPGAHRAGRLGRDVAARRPARHPRLHDRAVGAGRAQDRVVLGRGARSSPTSSTAAATASCSRSGSAARACTRRSSTSSGDEPSADGYYAEQMNGFLTARAERWRDVFVAAAHGRVDRAAAGRRRRLRAGAGAGRGAGRPPLRRDRAGRAGRRRRRARAGDRA